MKYWIPRILLLGALALSTYLLYVSLSSGVVAGCDGGSDCGKVLSSRWSHLGPLPVSAMAVLAYLTLFILSWSASPRWRSPLLLLSTAVIAGIIWFISLQFFVLQAYCVYCLASHALGFTGTVALLWLVFHSPNPVRDRDDHTSAPRLIYSLSGGILIAVIFIGLQVWIDPPSTHMTFQMDGDLTRVTPPDSTPSLDAAHMDPVPIETADKEQSASGEKSKINADTVSPPVVDTIPVEDPKSETKSDDSEMSSEPSAIVEDSETASPPQNSTGTDTGSKPEPVILSLHNGRYEVSTATDPYMGEADARKVMVSLFDYTCTHCKKTHKTLEEAMDRVHYDLAVILIATPLNRHCNPAVTFTPPPGRPLACEYARLALAVYRIDARAFQEFDSWLFSDTSPVFTDLKTGPDTARRHAEQLVGAEALTAALQDPWIDRTLNKNAGIYAANNEKTGRHGLPQQIIGTTINLGTIDYVFDLMMLLNRHLPESP